LRRVHDAGVVLCCEGMRGRVKGSFSEGGDSGEQVTHPWYLNQRSTKSKWGGNWHKSQLTEQGLRTEKSFGEERVLYLLLKENLAKRNTKRKGRGN